MNNQNNRPLLQQWAGGIDFKTILIIILGLLVAFIFLFNAGWQQSTGYSDDQVDQLKAIFEERITGLEEKNSQLTDSIVVYTEVAKQLRESVNDREGVIDELQEIIYKEQKKIDDLLAQRKEIRDEIKNLDDKGIEDWWIEYFKSKEKK
jgi:peptidoglycan hydrolase CwlO-like protein|tara:strand:- start:10555 stop:11001 length:447 start_codon:yes stop_codon:yes gene_type:complete